MKSKLLITLLLLILLSGNTFSQPSFNYELSLVPVAIPNLPGLHSYSFAQHEGLWLIIGGRKDGLHPRQPFASFPSAQSNTEIYVVDVKNLTFWSSSVNALPTNLKEQLQSTNMNFHQDNDTLYIIGGYGFSESKNDHITYPYLTSVNVPNLINAIKNNQNIAPYFKQIEDSNFAVTGGHLNKLKGIYYLVGGHRFDGRYNPMGNPTYTQTYTNQIRKFSINNFGEQLGFSNYSTITDEVHLHRRDYNLLPQIFPNGEEGFTISSGVFQINADLPFLYPVDIKENEYIPQTSFNQYLSNYHSAVANLYDSLSKNMHSLFFGGISQYYYQNGNLIEDKLSPFVKTISRLTRDSLGNLYEYQLPIEMPALKGASAELIPNLTLPHFDSEIIKLSSIEQSSFMIGHIFGGINSTSINPFTNNQTNLTNADNTIYEVWLTRIPLSINDFAIDGANPYEVSVLPNPFDNSFIIKFKLDKPATVRYIITNYLGQVISNSDAQLFSTGDISIKVEIATKIKTPLFLTVVFDDKYYVRKGIIQ